ncbi:hypothetical protein CEXT_324111 [Caerostris extrusa]|uniref:Uncharacterized protein n=1 Tax=Caerostris extrusa TaxID=172846 RepID=A0AAV4XNZ2_CAEEX|nr:hypothetical protein CEXT_324111 [Caerostris extrusa]
MRFASLSYSQTLTIPFNEREKSRRTFVSTFHKSLTHVNLFIPGDRGFGGLSPPPPAYLIVIAGLCFEGRLLNENSSPKTTWARPFQKPDSLENYSFPPPLFFCTCPLFLLDGIVVYVFPWTIAKSVIVL